MREPSLAIDDRPAAAKSTPVPQPSSADRSSDEVSLGTLDRVLLLLSGIPLSTFGSLSLLNFGGRFIPELFIVPWTAVMFLRSTARRRAVKRFFLDRRIATVFMLITFISIIGMLRQDASLMVFYGRYRALMLGVLGLVLSYYIQAKPDKNRLISQGLILVLLGNGLFSLIDVSPGEKQPIPALGFMICVLYFAERKNATAMWLTLVAFAFATLFSFYRVNYGVFLLTALMVVAHSLTGMKHRKRLNMNVGISKFSLITALFAVAALTLIVSNWGYIFDYLSATPERYSQSIAKYNAMMEGLRSGRLGNPSDADRSMGLSFFWDNFAAFVPPNGIVNDASPLNYSIWGGERRFLAGNLGRDSVFSYLVQFLGFGLLSLMAAVCSILFALSVLRAPNFIAALRQICLLAAFTLIFFTDGLTLTQFERSFQFGIAFGVIFPLPNRPQLLRRRAP